MPPNIASMKKNMAPEHARTVRFLRIESGMSAYLSYRHCHMPNAITSKPPKVKRKGILQSGNISVQFRSQELTLTVPRILVSTPCKSKQKTCDRTKDETRTEPVQASELTEDCSIGRSSIGMFWISGRQKEYDSCRSEAAERKIDVETPSARSETAITFAS